MNKQRNVDWAVAFELAARAGPHELVRALTTAMEHECTTAIEKFDATLARQRAECDTMLAQQRADYDASLARQETECDAALARQSAEFEQRFTALKHELLAKIDDELLAPVITALRRELAAAHAELDRLRAAQPAH
jgi:hypothetical protein